MDPLAIIRRYYPKDSKTFHVLVAHGRGVSEKALAVAKRVSELQPDLQFIEEAAMLHDIGIFLTHAPEIGCFGDRPYICHGYLGRELLEREGLPKHALVCERHIGVGLSRRDIEEQELPLPLRDMLPLSVEEQIICFADKFFSKNPGSLTREKSLAEIRKSLARFGEEKVRIFDEWVRKFRE